MVELCILGTGATMPVPGRALTAVSLSCGGRTILFDCGEGTQLALRCHHVSPAKIDLIALSHYHGDHIFGLPGLLQTIGCLGRTEPLYFWGPQDLEAVLRPILQLSGPMPFPIYLLKPSAGALPLHELDKRWPREASLQAVPTVHRAPSQAYVFQLGRAGRFDAEKARALGVPQAQWSRLQRGETVRVERKRIRPEQVMGPARKGLRVVFSGDTAPCDALEKAARGADLLLHEATYGTDEQADQAALYGHSTFSQAGALAGRAAVRRLVLLHFSQILEEPESYLPFARRYFPAAECGTDGQRIQLRFEES